MSHVTSEKIANDPTHNNDVNVQEVIGSFAGNSANILFKLTCKEGPTLIMKVLLSDLWDGRMSMLSDEIELSSIDETAQIAAENGQIDMLKSMLPNLDVDYEHDSSFLSKFTKYMSLDFLEYMIELYSMAGDLEMVQELFAKAKAASFKLTWKNTLTLSESCRLGRNEVVGWLLTHGGCIVEDGPPGEVLVGTAVCNGYIEIVRQLGQDSRVDPGLDLDFSFCSYCEVGDMQRASALLADPQVDPSSNDNCAAGKASLRGRVEVLKLLLADTRVNPAANGNYALKMAIEHNHNSVVQLLLDDDRILESGGEQVAFESASAHGNLNLIRQLMDRLNVVLTKEVLVCADKGGHESVIQFFMDKQPEVVSKLCTDRKIMYTHDGPLLKLINPQVTELLLQTVKHSNKWLAAGKVNDMLGKILEQHSIVHHDDEALHVV